MKQLSVCSQLIVAFIDHSVTGLDERPKWSEAKCE
jgi:hypothetical protein